GIVSFFLLAVAAAAPPQPSGEDSGALLARIKAVGSEGAGNAEASRAWSELVRRGPGVLPSVLAAWGADNPGAAHWLRTLVDAIAEREVRVGRPLPAAVLEAFVRDTRHAGLARRLAYEWLVRADPTAPGRLLPGMLHDPSAELRRDAVARAQEHAK